MGTVGVDCHNRRSFPRGCTGRVLLCASHLPPDLHYLRQDSGTPLRCEVTEGVALCTPEVGRQVFAVKCSGVRTFRKEVPEFLINRPREFVTHVLKRWSTDLDDTSVLCVNETNGVFTVKSETDLHINYNVILGGNAPSCSCDDWKKYMLPCKHICVVLRLSMWQWDKIGKLYTDNPLFKVDMESISLETDFVTERHHDDQQSVWTPVPEMQSLPPRRRSRRIVEIQKCVQTYKRLIDLVYIISDPDHIAWLRLEGEELIDKSHSYVKKDQGLPVIESPQKIDLNVDIKPLPKRRYGKPKLPGAQRYGSKAEAQKIDVWEHCSTDEQIGDVDSAVSFESQQWITVKGIKLSHTDRRQVLETMWLDDNIINVCQNLLSEQYPSIGGLVDTIILSHSSADVVVVNHMLQIHHIGAHWVVSEAFGTKVSVYDSLPFSSIAEMLREQLVKVYQPLFTGTNKVLTVNYICCQEQHGGSDCGLFAVANCVALANKMDPRKMIFVQDQMRKHLVKCIDEQTLEPFPFSTSEKKAKIHKVRLSTYCVCHMYSSEPMVQCDKCNIWLHIACAGISEKDKRVTTKKTFVCKKCKN